jgi:4-carboxymuconolactone decarboxylase
MDASAAAGGRLPWLEPGQLTEEQAALHGRVTGGPRAADSTRSPISDDRGRLRGPFNAMLFNPEVGEPMQALGAALRYRTSLSDRTREIATLVVAAELESDFERWAHEPLARAAGVRDEVIAALAARRKPDGLDAIDHAVWAATRALVRDGDLTDDAFAALQAAVGPVGCVETVALVGYYRMLALALRAFRVPIPDSAPTHTTEGPRQR